MASKSSASLVRWRWLAEVFDNDEFDVPGDGSVHVNATGGRGWHGDFAANVSWDSLAIVGGGRFGWDGRKLSLDSLAARSRLHRNAGADPP